MLTTSAASYYGTPILIRQASDTEGLRSACKQLAQVKPKKDERVTVVAFRKRMEET